MTYNICSKCKKKIDPAKEHYCGGNGFICGGCYGKLVLKQDPDKQQGEWKERPFIECYRCGNRWQPIKENTVTPCPKCRYKYRDQKAPIRNTEPVIKEANPYYVRRNYLKSAEKNGRKRAIKMGRKAEIVSYKEIVEKQNNICHICGEYIKEYEMHFDHVMPLSKGGDHVFDNIKLAHAGCNLSKNGRLMGECEFKGGQGETVIRCLPWVEL